MLESLRIAFATYSRIPVGHNNWSERGMKYSLCFFPLVGAVIGFAELLLFCILNALHAGPLLRGCLLTVLPILITGGIHIDGFMDTLDALQSMKSREEKLEIMKDPHVGVFALIGLVVYMVISVGIWSRISIAAMPLVIFIFMMSRALSGLAAASFPKARKDGMLATMTDPMDERAIGILGVEVIALAVAVIIAGICLGHIGLALLLLLLFAVVYVIYYLVMLYQFGGTTGDLAGWFLQLVELVCLLVTALVMH